MKQNFWKLKIFIACTAMLLSLVFIVPRAGAQFTQYIFDPYLGLVPIGFPVFPSAFPAYPFDPYRTAAVPLATPGTSLLFPAPTLPALPVATVGGVGVSTLIPTVSVLQAISLAQLIPSPIPGLIAYSPLSLVGLTYAPVPIIATAPLLPVSFPALNPITTTTLTAPATSAFILSLLSTIL